MSQVQGNIQLKLVNNTDQKQKVSLFDLNDVTTNPNTQKYVWDVTSFVFTTEQTVRVQCKKSGESSFTDYTAPILNSSIQGVVNALNTLGLGTFFSYIELGSTYIAIYSLYNVFGSLRIFDITQVEVYYDVTTTTITGQLTIKPQFAATPNVVINYPPNANGVIVLPLDVQFKSITPSLSFMNYQVIVNGTLVDSGSIDAITFLDYTFEGGDIVQFNLFE